MKKIIDQFDEVRTELERIVDIAAQLTLDVVRLRPSFLFQQKSAYEIRKGDWSSDVCSSDLVSILPTVSQKPGTLELRELSLALRTRSEERRVGNARPLLCRCRSSPCH